MSCPAKRKSPRSPPRQKGQVSRPWKEFLESTGIRSCGWGFALGKAVSVYLTDLRTTFNASESRSPKLRGYVGKHQRVKKNFPDGFSIAIGLNTLKRLRRSGPTRESAKLVAPMSLSQEKGFRPFPGTFATPARQPPVHQTPLPTAPR